MSVKLYLIKTRLNLTSNFLDQNNPKSEYLCKNELIYIKDFEAVQKNSQSRIIRFKNFRRRLEFLYLIIHSCSFFKQYITTHIQVFCTVQGLSPSTLFYQGGKGVFRDV